GRFIIHPYWNVKYCYGNNAVENNEVYNPSILECKGILSTNAKGVVLVYNPSILECKCAALLGKKSGISSL
ncbi:MAG TPA: hypothetical protein VIL26_07860, partial [Clostridia bacterium]